MDENEVLYNTDNNENVIISKIDLKEWNIQMYYEEMGYDFINDDENQETQK